MHNRDVRSTTTRHSIVGRPNKQTLPIFVDLHDNLNHKHWREEEEMAKNGLLNDNILTELHYLCDKVDKITKGKKIVPKDLPLAS